jgi:hypothetical protein
MMRQLQGIFRCFVLSVGLCLVRPEEIEELMYLAQAPKVAHSVRVEEDKGDGGPD